MYKIKINELQFKKWWIWYVIGLLMLLVLGGCGGDNDEKVDKEDKVTVTEPKDNESKDKEEGKTGGKDESSIDTSAFEYAKKVKVTDARNLTEHINLVVFMDDELTEGLAARHVLNQSYDFLQQADIAGAKTITIGVMVRDARIIQYTVDVAKFTPNDTEPMADLVLACSVVEKISPAVKEFAEVAEWKINE